MMKKAPKLLILVFTTLLFSMPMVTFAQEDDSDTCTGPDCAGVPGTNDVATPFDGGVSILVAFGVVYGIKKMRKNVISI